MVEVRQVEDVPGLVGEDIAVRRALLEDGDEPAQIAVVGVHRMVEVDDLGGVRVDARGVRVGDEIDHVEAAEVHERVGGGDRVVQIRGAPRLSQSRCIP